MTSDEKRSAVSENGCLKDEKDISYGNKLDFKRSSLKNLDTGIENKSSTEILTELFSAFNAEPPVIEEVSGDGEKSEKSSSKNAINHRSSVSPEGEIVGDRSKEKKAEKKKKEKKKKHKRKSSKHRHGSKKESDILSGLNRLHRSREKDKDDIATYSKIKEKLLKASASNSKPLIENQPSSANDATSVGECLEIKRGVFVDDKSNAVSQRFSDTNMSIDIPDEANIEIVCDLSHVRLPSPINSMDCPRTESRNEKGAREVSADPSLDLCDKNIPCEIEVDIIPLPEDCASQEHALVKINHNLKNFNKEMLTSDMELPSSTVGIVSKSERNMKNDCSLDVNRASDFHQVQKIDIAQSSERKENSSVLKLGKCVNDNMEPSDCSQCEKLESNEKLDSQGNERSELPGKSVKASSSVPEGKAKSKIKIKNLKFSTVFQQTLKEAEEQARKKEEEKQEYNDSLDKETEEKAVKNTEENINYPQLQTESTCDPSDHSKIPGNKDGSDDQRVFDSTTESIKEMNFENEEPDLKNVNLMTKNEDALPSIKDCHSSKQEQEHLSSDKDDQSDECDTDKAKDINESNCKKRFRSRSVSKCKVKEKKKRSRSKSREKSKKSKKKSPVKTKSRSRSPSKGKRKKRRSRSTSRGGKSKRKKSCSRSKERRNKSHSGERGKKSLSSDEQNNSQCREKNSRSRERKKKSHSRERKKKSGSKERKKKSGSKERKKKSPSQERRKKSQSPSKEEKKKMRSRSKERKKKSCSLSKDEKKKSRSSSGDIKKKSRSQSRKSRSASTSDRKSGDRSRSESKERKGSVMSKSEGERVAKKRSHSRSGSRKRSTRSSSKKMEERESKSRKRSRSESKTKKSRSRSGSKERSRRSRSGSEGGRKLSEIPKRKKKSRSRSKSERPNLGHSERKSWNDSCHKSHSESRRSRSQSQSAKKSRSVSGSGMSQRKSKSSSRGKSSSRRSLSRGQQDRSRSKSKSKNDSKKKSRSRSVEKSKKKSRSRSKEKSKKKSRSRSRTKEKSRKKSRSRSKEKNRKKSRSRSRKRSRSKSRRKSRSRSKSRRKSRSRSKSRRKSRSRSRSRKKSRSRSKSRRKSRSRSKSRRKSRSRSRKKSRSRSRKKSRSRSRRKSRSKSRRKSRSRSRKKSRSRSPRKSRSRSRRKSRSRSRRKSRSRSRRKSRSRSRRKSRSRSRRKSRSWSRSRKRSLSLIKCWRKSRSRSHSKRSRERSKRSRSKGRSSRGRKRNLSEKQSTSPVIKKRSRSGSGKRSQSMERSRSRSRSRKRSKGGVHDKEKESRRSKTVEKTKLAAAGGCESGAATSITSGDDGKIGEGEEEKLDKARLLEIARKNAVNLLQQGSLPPSVVGKDQKGKLLSLKAGGKSVEELTEYCKELSRKEAMGESSDSDGDGGSGSGSHAAPVIHHPFQIKERPAPGMIGIGIRTSLPPANAIMDKPSDQSKLRMQFPVSSGQEHRKTESDSPLAICYPEEASIAEDSNSIPGDILEEKEKLILDPKDQVFPDYSNFEQNMDIGSIVSQRLTALRKLQENPDDVDALNEMTQAQKDMQVWAESKSQPGLFTGSTGAKVLSAAELASGSQAWARKDQLKCATPLTGGMGMLLLQKMGWRPGEGLGKNKEGVLEPLRLDVKTDKRGLVSQEELHRHTNVHRRGHVARSHSRHSFGKHPVSVLVEICSKRRWKVPHFQLVFESGPDHKKSFLFKAIVNGVEYLPPAPSPNKKQAKAHAASICLQAIGVYPPSMGFEGACI